MNTLYGMYEAQGVPETTVAGLTTYPTMVMAIGKPFTCHLQVRIPANRHRFFRPASNLFYRRSSSSVFGHQPRLFHNLYHRRSQQKLLLPIHQSYLHWIGYWKC